MTLLILMIVVGGLVVWLLARRGHLTSEERSYLRRRGYDARFEGPSDLALPVDVRIGNLVASLSDLSPFSRRRAAEDLTRLYCSGHRDPRVVPAVIRTLDDSDPSVRSAAAGALGQMGDVIAIGALKRRFEIEEMIQPRVSIQKALEELAQRIN